MLIPYNSNRLHTPAKDSDVMMGNHLNPDHVRWELHRVWVVDATLKPGMSHVVARKTFFIDEDSHSIALEDSYDGRGNLWRAHAYPLVQAYDAKVMFQAPFITSDLTNGNVLVEALTNERKAPAYVWAQKAKLADFQVDAIRRRGTR